MRLFLYMSNGFPGGSLCYFDILIPLKKLHRYSNSGPDANANFPTGPKNALTVPYLCTFTIFSKLVWASTGSAELLVLSFLKLTLGEGEHSSCPMITKVVEVNLVPPWAHEP